MRKPIANIALLVMFATAVAPIALGQSKTATAFYLEYRQAFEKAATVEEIVPYLAKARKEQIEKTPADQRSQMFEMMKLMGTLKDLKIVKETKTETGYQLEATATDGDGSPSTGTILIVLEGKDLKIDKESWASKG